MLTFVILAVVFAAGVIAGIIALVCLSIRGEESGNSLNRKPPTRAAAATRRLLGWHGPDSGQFRVEALAKPDRQLTTAASAR
jgi:hypothetical protein